MAKVKVKFIHHHGDHLPGDVDEIDEVEASRLVKARRVSLVGATAKKTPAKKAASTRKRAAAKVDGQGQDGGAGDAPAG